MLSEADVQLTWLTHVNYVRRNIAQILRWILNLEVSHSSRFSREAPNFADFEELCACV